MKKAMLTIALAALTLASCTSSSMNIVLDTTVAGQWHGGIGAISLINFHGEKIFLHVSTSDSTFSLITRDTTRASTPVILDTTLVLSGAWRMNAPQDSILLMLDTCRIVDTLQNALVPRAVRGQVAPVGISIVKNQDETIEWDIALSDFVPLAPLLGIDLSGIPTVLLQGVMVALIKTSQQ